MKIYKYPIQIQDQFKIEMPMGSRILSFQVQNNYPFIWVMVNETNNPIERCFSLIGTGYEFIFSDDIKKYIGTIQMNEGKLVWHLFEDLL